MSIYKAPVEEAVFLLEDVLGFSSYSQLPGFADVGGDLLAQILGESGRLCEKVLHPLNAVGDRDGCLRREDGAVLTPKGFVDAYRAVAEGGWIGRAPWFWV